MSNHGSPVVREVTCKSALVKSGICDYAVNCYTGCENACVYCYARFASRFAHGQEAWGSFVDVKINAPEVLRKQLGRPRTYPGTVFLSSVCDGWQRLEEKYQLTRACLGPLLDAGFELHILTKRTLVERDFDILAGRERVELGCTVTCAGEALRKIVEPDASPTADRIETLRRAAKAGMRTYAFIGPLMPGITDTQENIEGLVGMLATTGIRYAYADRLNLRWGVWPAVSAWVRQHQPKVLPHVKAALWSAEGQEDYERMLRKRLMEAVRKVGLKAEIKMVC
jgi:DNA repair photolyase